MIARIEKKLEVEQNAQKQLSEEKERLSEQLGATQTELDALRNRWAASSARLLNDILDSRASRTAIRALDEQESPD